MPSRRSNRAATQPKDYSYQNFWDSIENATSDQAPTKRKATTKINSDDDTSDFERSERERSEKERSENEKIRQRNKRARVFETPEFKLENVIEKPVTLFDEASDVIGTIDGVLVISRKSSVSPKVGLVEELHARNKEIYAGFVDILHKAVHACSRDRPCQLKFSSHVIYALSSNTNMMTTTQRDVIQIRKTLDGFVSPQSQASASMNGATTKTVFLLWCGIDGFTTNLQGFVALCQKYRDLGIKIYVMMFRKEFANNQWPLYDASAIQAAVGKCKDATATGKPLDHETPEIEWVMGALNAAAIKETTSMLSRERKLQLTHQRNEAALTFEVMKLPLTTREYTGDAVANRIRDSLIKDGTQGITPRFSSLVKDEETGGLTCPLAGCEEISTTFDDLVVHLYNHSDGLSCSLCDENSLAISKVVRFTSDTPSKSAVNHIEAHLPPQKYCQIDGCKSMGKARTTKGLADHMLHSHSGKCMTPRPHPCTVDGCDYHAIDEEELAGHLLAQHDIGEGRTKRYICQHGCGEEFKYRTSRQRHQNEACHLRPNIVLHVCPICQRTFHKYDAKHHHIKKAHGLRDEIAGVLQDTAGIKLPDIDFRSAIETNLLGKDQ